MAILGAVLVALAALLLVHMLSSGQQIKHSQSTRKIGSDFQLLELDLKPLVLDEDLVQYEWRTHTMHLKSGTVSRLELKGTIFGTAFLVCAEGEVCYQGMLTTINSSSSQKCVAIVFGRDVDGDRNSLRLDLGYPAPAFFQGDDPRSDPRIRSALLRSGKFQE
jgi:hypothetical protein